MRCHETWTCAAAGACVAAPQFTQPQPALPCLLFTSASQASAVTQIHQDLSGYDQRRVNETTARLVFLLPDIRTLTCFCFAFSDSC